MDFSTIGADLLSKGAAHIAQKNRPTEEQLGNVDCLAPDDEFITAGGRPAGPLGETPVPELSVPASASKTLQQHPDENDTHMIDTDGTKKDIRETIKQAQGQYGKLKEQLSPKTGHRAQDFLDTDSSQEAEEKKMGMREKIRQMGVSLNCPFCA